MTLETEIRGIRKDVREFTQELRKALKNEAFLGGLIGVQRAEIKQLQDRVVRLERIQVLLPVLEPADHQGEKPADPPL